MKQDFETTEKYSKRIGGTMTLLAWFLFLGVLTVLFGNFLERESNPNRDVTGTENGGAIEVILEQNRAGHYVANARINDVPVAVMIDTGASNVSVPADLAEKTGLVRGPAMEVTTANGTIRVYMTVIDRIELGRITLNNVRASINPHMNNEFVLLGMSFLEKLEFSQSRGNLTLRQHN
jgi:aspartyl protease family protein